MPERVHFLVSEPERELLSIAIRAVKQSVARKLIGEREHFWQARYYDFNVWSASKIREKLRYSGPPTSAGVALGGVTRFIGIL